MTTLTYYSLLQKDMHSKHNKIHFVNTTSNKTSVKYTKNIYTSGIQFSDSEWKTNMNDAT
jgi:hypothetical protein